jgi:hypothetical protein
MVLKALFKTAEKHWKITNQQVAMSKQTPAQQQDYRSSIITRSVAPTPGTSFQTRSKNIMDKR